MSIQEIKNKKLIFRLIYKFKLISFFDKILHIRQFIFRGLFRNCHIDVFFPYYTSHTHPYIRERWYKKTLLLYGVIMKMQILYMFFHFLPAQSAIDLYLSNLMIKF
jgi:hypothetical protein